ncbi:glycosyltransferase [Xenophilus arseniciresistens]|uniref:Glycosyltransferase n=1 Tax=Xenophilus arseniciresistens TaxID=1283306 RepID=A0AAE3SY00_9BURK|nr:glycosyltransferase [Xenophilus arseniciresistens]MDA7415489.1 glycosyltransferase [Xenophilus arseniciresistens]
MKILYLTWGETPRTSGAYGSQALNQFKANIALTGATGKFVAAVPLIHSGHVRERGQYTHELKNVRERLANIEYEQIPIYCAQPLIFPNRWTFKFNHIGANLRLRQLVDRFDPDVIHCRSYHATFAALRLREATSARYRILFDARGLWIDELALRKGWESSSRNYRFFRALESYLLGAADAVVAVSEGMKEYFISQAARRVETIYLSAPVRLLSSAAVRTETYVERVSVVYLGTLDSNSWHPPDELRRLIEYLLKLGLKIDLKIITMSDHAALEPIFKPLGLGSFRVVRTHSAKELAAELREADFGVLSYFRPTGVLEHRLSSVVMAIKTAEYLGAGVPILVNKHCGGAAGIVREHRVGLAYDPESFSELTRDAVISLLEPGVRRRAIDVAFAKFDIGSNAQRYASLYSSLAAPN